MNREELAARLETMADRMVLMASACPPIACGAILSDAKVLREAAQLIRESSQFSAEGDAG